MFYSNVYDIVYYTVDNTLCLTGHLTDISLILFLLEPLISYCIVVFCFIQKDEVPRVLIDQAGNEHVTSGNLVL